MYNSVKQGEETREEVRKQRREERTQGEQTRIGHRKQRDERRSQETRIGTKGKRRGSKKQKRR